MDAILPVITRLHTDVLEKFDILIILTHFQNFPGYTPFDKSDSITAEKA
jgi:hypothetical protein